MGFETVVIEELRNLDGDRFRVRLWTEAGPVSATLLLADEIPPPSVWKVGDWFQLVSEIEDGRPEGASDVKQIVIHVAYRLSLAAFVKVPLEEPTQGAAWSSTNGARGVSVALVGGTPIPVKVCAHEGAGDDDTPFRAWAAEIADVTPFLASTLASTLRTSGAEGVDSTERAVAALMREHGMKFRLPPDGA